MRRRQPPRRVWKGLFLSVAGLIAVAASAGWFQLFAGSQAFVDFLSRRIGEATGTVVRMQPLRWEGTSARCPAIALQGTGTSRIRSLDATDVSARWDWRALGRGLWRIEAVSVDTLDVVLQSPPPSTPAVKSSAAPSRIEWTGMEVRRANLAFESHRLSQSRLDLVPVSGGFDVKARGGILHMTGLPTLEVLEGTVRQRGVDFELSNARFRSLQGGQLEASGRTGRASRLDVSWAGIPTESLPVQEIDGWLDGNVSGSATRSADGHWQGRFEVAGGSLRRVAVLDQVAAFLDDPALRNPRLKEFRGSFDVQNERTLLTALALESDGLVRIEGTLTIHRGGAIEGDLHVGVPDSLLRHFPGAREEVFSTAWNGWNWAPLSLGGTLENPTENLSNRLATAVAKGVIMKHGGRILEQVAPPGAADAVRGVLESLLPSFGQ